MNVHPLMTRLLIYLHWPFFTSSTSRPKSQTATLPLETNAGYRVGFRDLVLSDDSQGVGIPGMLE